MTDIISDNAIVKEVSITEFSDGHFLNIPHGQLAMIRNNESIQHIILSGSYALSLLDVIDLKKHKMLLFKTDSVMSKFGTASPLTFMDQDDGPIQLRLFGNVALTLRFPKRLLDQIPFTESMLQDKIRSIIVSKLQRIISEFTSIKQLFLESNTLQEKIIDAVFNDIEGIGFTLTDIKIENISLMDSDNFKNAVYKKLMDLKQLHTSNAISDADFETQKNIILKKLS